MKRKRLLIAGAAIAAVIVIVVLIAVVAARQRVRRRTVFHPRSPASAPSKVAPGAIPPIGEWSAQFERLGPAELDALLDQIESKEPAAYANWSLAYLHARARLERNDVDGAAKKLGPFLAPGHPLRDLALHHQAGIDDDRHDTAAASAHRRELIFNYPSSIYRDEAIDEEMEHLGAGAPQPLLAFASRLMPAATPSRRRDFEVRIAESQLQAGDVNGGLARALAVLQGGTMDDAAERASRAIDRPELLRRLNAQQAQLLGEAFRNHRHFDRAVALLSLALRAMPQKRDELTFAIGRSYYGNEKYAEAKQTYLSGAAAAATPAKKAEFLWHAARATQLLGDDRGAEQLMTASIAVPGRSPAANAALTQRIRTRLGAKRVAEAAADVQQLRKLAPADRAIADAELAMAVAMIGGGNPRAGLAALNSVPPGLLDAWDRPEFAYWRGRALEGSDPRGAFQAYLTVLRTDVPTHFAYFARQRLDAPAMGAKVAQEVAARDAEVARLMAAKQFAQAKDIATDRVLLSGRDRKNGLAMLTKIYRELPAYRAVLDLKPSPLPSFPLSGSDATLTAANRATALMAMGLYDEAPDEIVRRYPLHPLASALTQSVALNRGNVSKPSIYAIEVLMKGIPQDYVPDLLPETVRELLYPRYFFNYISEDSKKYGADPALVLSIMREESRFNPRAKSQAAARGLLQFIITTARDIGRDIGLVDVAADDLYDPRVIIRLGAKYIATLSKQFADDHYKVASAYNAGPNQTALWSRLAPGPGDDFFLSSINFDETKDYVRKVMNSHKRYEEIYGGAGPQGGLRVEP